MTRFRRTSLVCALVAGLLALAACGGSNDASSDGASGGDATDEQAPATTAPAEATVSTVGNVPGLSEGCEAILNFVGATGQILGGQIDTAEGRALLDDFLGSVSDEIRADASVLAEATKSLLDAIEQFGDFAAAITDPAGQAALAALDTPEYTQAANNLGDYVAAECPIGG